MKDEVDALLKALSESGCEGAEAAMPALLGAIKKPVDEDLIQKALGSLRGQSCFGLMKEIANQVIEVVGEDTPIQVRLQLAQAKIDLGRLDEAIALLDALKQKADRDGTARDRSELTGLLGRARKQRFVKAVSKGEGGEEDLRAAVEAYSELYDSNPAWHGANLVALIKRAENEGIDVDSERAETWARKLLRDLKSKGRPEWSPWDYASAGEAYLALEDEEGAADCFAHYWNMSNADPFALAGTERQLREIWRITPDSDNKFLASLLVHLEARKLTAAGSGAKFTPEDLQRLASHIQAVSGDAEATYGAGSAIPLERMLFLISKARSICQIIDINDQGKAGTGFLVAGADLGLDPPHEGVFVLTNHHVLHGDEADDDLLARTEYRGSIYIENAQAVFHYWEGEPKCHTIKLKEIVAWSPRSELDFTVASLAEPVSEDLKLELCTESRPLGSRNNKDAVQRAQVFVIGHPEGGDLSFSVSDSEVVDHQLDGKPCDGPRRIHYRTPTEPGSSGSPVFHHTNLKVVGLHRSGKVHPLRPDWPQRKPDEAYEANEAVSIRSVLKLE